MRKVSFILLVCWAVAGQRTHIQIEQLQRNSVDLISGKLSRGVIGQENSAPDAPGPLRALGMLLLTTATPASSFSLFSPRADVSTLHEGYDGKSKFGHRNSMISAPKKLIGDLSASDLKLLRLQATRRALLTTASTMLLWPEFAHAAKGGTMRFSGTYSDPLHPDCERVIKPEGTGIVITGTDEVGGPQWKVYGKVKGDQVVIDFSPKGGPSEVVAQWSGESELYERATEGIFKFPDGNVWSRVNQRDKANALRFAGAYVEGKRAGVDAVKRRVQMSGFNAIVTGNDVEGGPEWQCKGKVVEDTLVLDFSPRGGPSKVVAQRTGKGLEFPDGTVWKCVGIGGAC